MNYSEQIKNYEREITINTSIIDQEYWHIGNALREHTELAEGLNKKSTESFNEFMDQANSSQDGKNQVQKEISSIETQLKAISDMEASIDKRESEKSNLEKDYEKMLMEFADKAFDLYASSPQPFLMLSDGFSELDKLHRDKFNGETKADQLKRKSESEPVFKRLVSQTKLQLQKTQIQNLEKKIDGAKMKTAAEMVENYNPETHADSSLREIISPVLDQKMKIAEIQRIIEKHRISLKELNEALAKECGKGKADDRITELQLRMSERDEELRKILTATGNLVYSELASSAPESLEEYFKNLRLLLSENEEKQKKILRLQAANRIQALEEEKSRFQLKQEKLSRQLDDIKEQLERVTQTIGDLDKEIETQGKIRGNTDDL